MFIATEAPLGEKKVQQLGCYDLLTSASCSISVSTIASSISIQSAKLGFRPLSAMLLCLGRDTVYVSFAIYSQISFICYILKIKLVFVNSSTQDRELNSVSSGLSHAPPHQCGTQFLLTMMISCLLSSPTNIDTRLAHQWQKIPTGRQNAEHIVLLVLSG